ncbi:Predicted phage phi-C31 gp36 major capsid-like protein [uncultured Ruminococcus sp.]|nr:Predicted phage phi-C31 gp36 major capsid-like protein [uncultured Ruminococcus sp.]
MKSNDVLSREEIRGLLQKAIKGNDTEGFYQAFDQMIECINQDVQQRYDAQLNDLKQEMDSRILSQRGVRQLTNKERDYYQKVAECMRSKDPKQALTNADLVMPKTIMESVFDDLQTRHELLSLINFVPTTGLTEMVMNTNGYQEAVWGKLCDDIVKELVSGFETIDMTQLKLSAFIPVCKAMLDLGPEWLDDYVRQVLYEALANGLEAGIVAGDGNEKPIGMNRQVGKGVTVTGGVYPEKAKITVTDLQPETIGNLLSIIAVDPNGKPRTLRDVVMIVNPQDYFQKVMPATTLMAPDGTYRNDVLPYPMRIVQTMALDRGEALLGLAYKYFGGAGMGKEGRIEYDDSYHFLEDERMYLIKLYANGFPMDNNAFLYLDISALQPAVWKVEQVTTATPSNNAALSDLKIGSLTLSPAFASETTTYTTSTTNATNTITATPADAKAAIEVKVGETEVDNGSAATWQEGSNTVTIKVTAADGKTTKTYTVTVTKS